MDDGWHIDLVCDERPSLHKFEHPSCILSIYIYIYIDARWSGVYIYSRLKRLIGSVYIYVDSRLRRLIESLYVYSCLRRLIGRLVTYSCLKRLIGSTRSVYIYIYLHIYIYIFFCRFYWKYDIRVFFRCGNGDDEGGKLRCLDLHRLIKDSHG